MGAGVILGREQFDAAIHSVSIPGEDGEQVGACLTLRAHDAALRQQVEELTRERDALRARLAAMATREATEMEAEGVEIISCGYQTGADVWNYVRDRLLAETVAQRDRECRCPEGIAGLHLKGCWYFVTAQGASAEPTVASGGAPRMPAPPVPTPLVSEADPEELIEEAFYRASRPKMGATYQCVPAAEASGWWKIISQHNGRADCEKTLPAAIDAEVKRREAALRERAEAAEAEVARMRSAAGRHHVDCDE